VSAAVRESAPIILAEDLRKVFVRERRAPGLGGALRSLLRPVREAVTAVDGVSFAIAPGEVVGYLGPNGAGKSTTIKILAGVLVPSSGRVLVNGLEPYRNRVANALNIGAVFGQRSQLWWDLPAIESFRILKEIYGVPDAAYARALAEFDDVLDLHEFWHTPVRQLSLGQRMRCDLAVAMLHRPPILYLDEPTVGMDVVAKERVRRFLLHLARTQGTTILLTTHDLGDVERLCRRILLIDHGRLIYDGGLEALKAREGAHRTLHVRFAEEVPDPHVEGAERTALEGTRASFRFPAARNPQGLISALAARYLIADLSIEEPDLEEVIRVLYERRRTQREEAGA
jgi:ABC-2 type transport system ATP-binding protein